MSNKSCKNDLINHIENSIFRFKKDIITDLEIKKMSQLENTSFHLCEDVNIVTDANKNDIYLLVKIDGGIRASLRGEFTKYYSYVAIDIKKSESVNYSNHISSLEKIDCLPWLFSEIVFKCIYGKDFIRLTEKMEWLLTQKEEISLQISKIIWGENYLEFFEEKVFCFNYFDTEKENSEKLNLVKI